MGETMEVTMEGTTAVVMEVVLEETMVVVSLHKKSFQLPEQPEERLVCLKPCLSRGCNSTSVMMLPVTATITNIAAH